MLARRLQNVFDPFVRQRGEIDVVRRVSDIDVSPRGVAATVVGTEPEAYRVELTHERRVLFGSCSCPYALGRQRPCKHLWALVRVCDDEGLLRAAADDPRVDFEFVANPDGVIRAETDLDDDPWRAALADVERGRERRVDDDAWSSGDRRAAFLVLAARSRTDGAAVFALRMRERDAKRRWGTPRRAPPLDADIVAGLPDEVDRELLGPLCGARDAASDDGEALPLPDVFTLPRALEVSWVRRAASEGRLFTGVERETSARVDPGTRLRWDDGEAWALALTAGPGDDDHDRVSATLRRGDEQRELSDASFLSPTGLVFWGNAVGRFDARGAYAWVAALRRHGAIEVPVAERARLVASLALVPVPADADVDPSLRIERIAVPPVPRLDVRTPRLASRRDGFDLDVTFDYGGIVVPLGDVEERVFRPDERRVVERDRAAEERALDQLGRHGARPSSGFVDTAAPYVLPSAHQLADLVVGLVRDGWRVWGDAGEYRAGAQLRLAMTATHDGGFDLTGGVTFDGEMSAPFSTVVAALRRRRTLVPLSDGSTGVLPDEWLDRYAALVQLGEPADESLRFGALQVGLVDALLEALPEIEHDDAVARARERLVSFEGIDAREPPESFVGELRGYQREGLGWLAFLRGLGVGGCLADDMGLGKTVQVLAALEERRRLRAGIDPLGDEPRPGTSLVVAPRSLVYNWISEAARFTPDLAVHDHTGTDRFRRLGLTKTRATTEALAEHFAAHDVVLTTYGTLRSDVELLAGIAFDHVVLDESQAIKNSRSQAAKAARALSARHRLALTGTPIENHLGELLSQFEFLNPGFRTWADRARRLVASPDEVDADDPLAPARLLARAVRPFLLRRTKEAVLDDLPPKTEQTLWCDLLPADRAAYDELRARYRRSLLDDLDDDGLRRSKMHVLEALLRLRQAACHRGLVDASAVDEPSSKLELLLDQLEQVTSTGHKALVFSQFTSLLALLRTRLDETSQTYEYLDGRTRDRGRRVEHFQTDPDCRLFLVSLKAGGVGLNLTAAQYVFLLDPWWNPAAEAQAIDRAHRIGQTESVFAYRIIARDTVEERVLRLQESKRALADAVVRADGGALADLTRADLELLLG